MHPAKNLDTGSTNHHGTYVLVYGHHANTRAGPVLRVVRERATSLRVGDWPTPWARSFHQNYA